MADKWVQLKFTIRVETDDPGEVQRLCYEHAVVEIEPNDMGVESMGVESIIQDPEDETSWFATCSVLAINYANGV